MGECVSQKFLLDDKVKDVKDFNDKFLREGKSLYEVMKVVKGEPIFFEDHIKRLYKSSLMTELKIWLNEDEIKNNIKKLCVINGIEDINVKIIFNYNKGKKSFLAYFIESEYPSEDMYLNGVPTSLYFAERENPNAKVINQNLRDSTNEVIKETGVYEVILVNKDNYITEGSRSNVFMIKEDRVITPPVQEVLPGITRKYVFEACKNLGYKIIEKNVKCNEIEKMDGIFISSTSPNILPIFNINDKNFNPKNSVIQNIRREFDSIIEKYIENKKKEA